MRHLTLKTYLQLLHQAQRASQDPTDGLKVYGPVKFHEFRSTLQNFLKKNQDPFENHYVSWNGKLEDLQLENRSYHFLAYKKGEVHGVLRLTPFPFLNINYSHGSIADLKNLRKHLNLRSFLEVSRFVVSRDFSSDRVAERLLLSSGLWSVTQTHMEGVFGVISQDRVEQFQSYGFQDLKTESSGRVLDHSPETTYAKVMGNEFEHFLVAMTTIHENSVSSFARNGIPISLNI